MEASSQRGCLPEAVGVLSPQSPGTFGRQPEPSTRSNPALDTARSLLGILAGSDSLSGYRQPEVDQAHLGRWLLEQGLGPVASRQLKEVWPALASEVQADVFKAAAENSLHLKRLERAAAGLQGKGVRAVLLKGVALAMTVYRDPALRPMSDVDIWVLPAEMPAAVRAMLEAGFTAHSKERRPLALQKNAGGEVQFTGPDGGLLELHWSPFSGWWLKRVAAVDDEALWERTEAIETLKPAALSATAQPLENYELRQLSAEDAIVHLCVHLGVNHRFSVWPVRSLVDIAKVARSRGVDWDVVASRAQKWRLATAVWAVLDLVDSLIGLPEMAPALERLRPSRLRRALLRRLVSPESILSGRDLRTGRERYILLLLLVDRPRDALRLVFRTLWPEAEWLDARYPQGGVSRWQYLWRVLRHGQI